MAYRKLYFDNKTYLCLKDVLYDLSRTCSRSQLLQFIIKLNPENLFTFEQLEKKKSHNGFHSYINEDSNNVLIEYLKNNDKKDYCFVVETHIKEIKKKLGLGYEEKKNRVLMGLEQVFKNEKYKKNHVINGVTIDFYLEEYKIFIQSSESYEQHLLEKKLENDMNGKLIHYSLYSKDDVVNEIIHKVINYIRNVDYDRYRKYYYYH